MGEAHHAETHRATQEKHGRRRKKNMLAEGHLSEAGNFLCNLAWSIVWLVRSLSRWVRSQLRAWR